MGSQRTFLLIFSFSFSHLSLTHSVLLSFNLTLLFSHPLLFIDRVPVQFSLTPYFPCRSDLACFLILRFYPSFCFRNLSSHTPRHPTPTTSREYRCGTLPARSRPFGFAARGKARVEGYPDSCAVKSHIVVVRSGPSTGDGEQP